MDKEKPKRGRPFQKGKSGNPQGRPKGRSAKMDLLDEIMRQAQESAYANGDVTHWELIAAAVVKQLERGNPAMHKLFWERHMGPLKTADEGEQDSERRVIVDI